MIDQVGIVRPGGAIVLEKHRIKCPEVNDLSLMEWGHEIRFTWNNTLYRFFVLGIQIFKSGNIGVKVRPTDSQIDSIVIRYLKCGEQKLSLKFFNGCEIMEDQ